MRIQHTLNQTDCVVQRQSQCVGRHSRGEFCGALLLIWIYLSKFDLSVGFIGICSLIFRNTNASLIANSTTKWYCRNHISFAYQSARIDNNFNGCETEFAIILSHFIQTNGLAQRIGCGNFYKSTRSDQSQCFVRHHQRKINRVFWHLGQTDNYF